MLLHYIPPSHFNCFRNKVIHGKCLCCFLVLISIPLSCTAHTKSQRNQAFILWIRTLPREKHIRAVSPTICWKKSPCPLTHSPLNRWATSPHACQPTRQNGKACSWSSSCHSWFSLWLKKKKIEQSSGRRPKHFRPCVSNLIALWGFCPLLFFVSIKIIKNNRSLVGYIQ